MEQQRPSPEAVNSEGEALAALLGIETHTAGKKKRGLFKKRLFLFLGAAVVLLGIAVGVWALFFRTEDTETAAVYREYTVERGDVVVGQSESSSISLNRVTVTFPVSAEVAEVYVKAGSSVKAGDPLVRLDADDVAEGLKSYELQLDMAALELEQAKLQQQTKLLQAEQTLESSEQTGDLARATANLTVAELEANVTKAQKTYEDAVKKLDDYCQLNLTYATDYANLQAAKNSMEYYTSTASSLKAAESSLSAAEAVLDGSKSTSSQGKLNAVYTAYATPTAGTGKLTVAGVEYSNLQEAITAWNGTDNTTTGLTQAAIEAAVVTDFSVTATAAATDVSTACTCYKDVKSAAAVLAASSYGSASAAQSAMAVNAANLTSATEQYNLQNTNFKEKYANASDEDDLAELVEEAKTALATAQLSLEKAQLSEATGKTAAEQKKDSAVNEADTASTSYELTVMELSQAVDAAQEAYNELLNQIEDVKELVSDDGIVYAEVSGMVSAVSVAVGDTVTVFVDEDTHKIMNYAQLLTMTDISDVYVPITISEEDILSVSIGQTAEVSMTAFPGRTFPAEVDTIAVESSRSGAATVSYTVNVKFSEENTLDLYEGMSAEVTLVQRAAKDVLYTNVQTVTNTNGTATVLIAGADGTPEAREVVTGFSDGRYVEIVSGLSEGDVVLAESAVGRS